MSVEYITTNKYWLEILQEAESLYKEVTRGSHAYYNHAVANLDAIETESGPLESRGAILALMQKLDLAGSLEVVEFAVSAAACASYDSEVCSLPEYMEDHEQSGAISSLTRALVAITSKSSSSDAEFDSLIADLITYSNMEPATLLSHDDESYVATSGTFFVQRHKLAPDLYKDNRGNVWNIHALCFITEKRRRVFTAYIGQSNTVVLGMAPYVTPPETLTAPIYIPVTIDEPRGGLAVAGETAVMRLCGVGPVYSIITTL